MKLKIHAFNLQLRHTFRIAHTSRDTQPTLIVELQDGPHRGFGEAAATSYYGVSIEGMAEKLESLREVIESHALSTPEHFWATMAPHLKGHSFAQCALDMAAHDLWGKQQGKPLYKLWNLQADKLPLSNYTIGIDTIDNMLAKMQATPWPVYKIKLGTEEDVAIIKALRQHSNAIFRVDANGAWTAGEAIQNSRLLKPLGVEFIEQPLQASSLNEMKEVLRHTALPVIADESCLTEEDIDTCKGHFNGINIKLTKCGGLTPALRMIAKAREQNMLVMAGCMTESSIGISAIAQLLPLLDFADLDGALLLKEDIASGITIQEGKVSYATENGTGARLFKDSII
jgi:L-Ala-D/L-Glu epimerase